MITTLIITVLAITTMQTNENTREISVAAWNANGISSRWCYLDNLRMNHDIVFVTEHKLYKGELHKLHDQPSLYCVHATASRDLDEGKLGIVNGHGGLAAYWHVSLNNRIRPIKNMGNDRVMVLQLQTNNISTYIIGVYMPTKHVKYQVL